MNGTAQTQQHGINKRPFGERLASFGNGAAALLTLAAFAAMALIGLFVTCAVETGFSADNSEHVAFLRDAPLVTLALSLALLIVLALLVNRGITKRTANVAAACMAACLTAAGLWWVLAAKAVPQADSAAILSQARLLAAGDTASMAGSTYFRVFPFQMGYLLYAELFCRVFGAGAGAGAETALAVSNVLCTAASALCLVKIADRLFSDARVTFLTAVLLGLCWQPVLLTTFLYGVLPGLCAALWSVWFALRFCQDGGQGKGRKRDIVFAALLITAAVLLKKNYLIVLIAEGCALLLYAVRTKRWLPVVCAAAMTLCACLAPRAVQAGYEARTGALFGEGTPQSAWLVTGFRESSMCSGWFNGYTTTVLAENGFDAARTKAVIRADLSEQLTMFSHRPRYLASFLYHKLVSQWNEPSFQCIWSSATGRDTGLLPPIVQSVYTGGANAFLTGYFNVYTESAYIGFAAALWLLFRRRGEDGAALRLLLPITVLGAFLYHALFEAKAQYALIYLPMMLPYAAYAVTAVRDIAAEAIRKRRSAR